MASPLNWVFNLFDNLSSPADKMSDALKGVDDNLKKTQADASKGIPVVFDIASAAQLGANAFGKITDFVGSAVGKAIDLGENMIKTAAAAQATEQAFKSLLGPEAAKETLDLIGQISGASKFDDDALAAALRPLVAAGFRGQKLLDAAALGLTAEAKLGGGIGTVEGVAEVLKKISLKGGVEEKALLGLGINTKEFFSGVSKQLGVTATTAEKMFAAGKIDANSIQNAIFNFVAKQEGGVLGKAFEDAGKTVEARLAKLAGLPSSFFKTIKDSEGFASLNNFLGEMLRLLDPAGAFGQAATKAIGDVFTKLFGNLDAAVVIKKFQGILESLLPHIQRIPEYVDKAITVLQVLWSIVSFGIDVVVELYREFKRLTEIGDLIGDSFARLNNFFVETFVLIKDRVSQFASDIYNGAIDIGGKLVQGIVDGVTGLASRAYDAVGNLGTGVIDGLKGVLGISSPSKVFEEIGAFTAEGFARGVSGDRFAGAAVENLGGARPAGGLSGGSPVSLELHVHVGDGPRANETGQEIAERLAPLLPGMLESAMEQLAIEAGAA